MVSVAIQQESNPFMSSGTRLMLPVEGMTCASCVGRVERALKAVPGVQTATVNLATERADITFSALADPQAAVRTIESASYTVPEETTGLAIEDAVRRESEARALRSDLHSASALTLPIFIVEMGSHLFPSVHHWVVWALGEQVSWYIQFALTTLVLFGPGLRFFRKGVPALLRGAPGHELAGLARHRGSCDGALQCLRSGLRC